MIRSLKITKMKKIIGLLSFAMILQIILLFELSAQKSFKPAYIIDLLGDTLYGEVDYKGDLSLGKKCVFFKDSIITEYKPQEIKSFRFIDSKYFVTREVENKKYFMEFLIKGKVNIFYLRTLTGDHYYIENDSSRLVEIPVEKEFVFINGKLKVNEAKRHIGVLKYFMRDAKDFDKRINSIKKIGHKELISIAKEYHNLVCKDETCVIYEKPPDMIRIRIEPAIGFGYVKNPEIKNSIVYQTGLQFNFWIPRVNERLYFRSGFLFTNIKNNNYTTTYYKIPLAIEYELPDYKVKWKMGYGMNIYKYFLPTIDLKLGIELPLSENLGISLINSAEFLQLPYFLILPGKFFANWVTIGLSYKLNSKKK